jgi:stage V sporulation protein S
MNEKMVLKVAGKSSVKSLTGSIVKAVEDGKQVELHTIGAGALNQAMKAVTSARGILASQGRDILLKSGFDETIINGEKRTMMKLFVIVQ